MFPELWAGCSLVVWCLYQRMGHMHKHSVEESADEYYLSMHTQWSSPSTLPRLPPPPPITLQCYNKVSSQMKKLSQTCIILVKFWGILLCYLKKVCVCVRACVRACVCVWNLIQSLQVVVLCQRHSFVIVSHLVFSIIVLFFLVSCLVSHLRICRYQFHRLYQCMPWKPLMYIFMPLEWLSL